MKGHVPVLAADGLRLGEWVVTSSCAGMIVDLDGLGAFTIAWLDDAGVVQERDLLESDI